MGGLAVGSAGGDTGGGLEPFVVGEVDPAPFGRSLTQMTLSGSGNPANAQIDPLRPSHPPHADEDQGRVGFVARRHPDRPTLEGDAIGLPNDSPCVNRCG